MYVYVIIIHMLNKRTNVLFEQTTWDKLLKLAKTRQTSVGQLIRQAVFALYFDKEKYKLDQRREAIDSIRRTRSEINHKFTTKEIGELINYGRKY